MLAEEAEIEFSSAGPLDCITERTDEHGYWWRYAPSQDEPGENLVTARRMAGDVASREARTGGKSYVVASQPSPAIYVFAFDYPDAGNGDTGIMAGFLPDGRRIRLEDRRRH
jgi:hypothetical protein